jgi:predicted transcriptional regulator
MTTLSLNIDARGAQKGAKDFKRATDQVKTSAMQADSAVDQMGASVARTSRGLSGRQTFIFQNTANQLGDIAVQASMGTNMFRVLGMQLPQIAGGFALLGGAVGIVAPILGVIAAIGFPILAVFTSMNKESEELGDNFDRLSDNITRFRNLNTVIDKEFAEPFRKANEAVFQYIHSMRRAAHEEIMRGLGESFSKFLAPVAIELAESLENVRELRKEANEILAKPEANRNLADLNNIMKEVDQTLETIKRNRALRDIVVDAFIGAHSAKDLAENFANARNEIEEMGDGAKDLLKEFDDILDKSGLHREILAHTRDTIINIKNNQKEANKELKESNKENLKQTRFLTREFERQLKTTRMMMKPLQDAADMVGNSFERAFMDAVTGTASVKDAFRTMAATIIAELYRIFVVKKITGFISSFIADPAMFGGLGGGGSFTGPPPLRPTSFDGGGYTGNGPRTGGLDGRGGFMAMLHPNETVIDHSRGNSGGEVVVNQTINVSTGVQQTVRNEIQTLLPQIAEASKAAVLDARRRGGSFANAF